jgi:hypothetical protein
MKPDMLNASIQVERLATAEEIHAATLPSADLLDVDEWGVETLWEIPSDFGGYIRIQVTEFETSLLIEEFNQEQNTNPN